MAAAIALALGLQARADENISGAGGNAVGTPERSLAKLSPGRGDASITRRGSSHDAGVAGESLGSGSGEPSSSAESRRTEKLRAEQHEEFVRSIWTSS